MRLRKAIVCAINCLNKKNTAGAYAPAAFFLTVPQDEENLFDGKRFCQI